MKDAAFDDGAAIFAFGGDEVEGVAILVLADAVDAAEALLQARRVPRHVIVDHQVAELEVDAFTSSLGCHANLALGSECFLRVFALVGIHAAVYLAGGVAPAGQVFLDVVERVAVLSKQQQFATAIFEFSERGAGQAFFEGFEFGVCGSLAAPYAPAPLRL